MNKLVYLGLIVSLFSFQAAIASSSSSEERIPANSLEEMMETHAEGFQENYAQDWDPGRGGHHGEGFVCEARNRRGHTFKAWGHRPSVAQERALDQCRQVSFRCFPLGCRRN